jgi:hypothetical protein
VKNFPVISTFVTSLKTNAEISGSALLWIARPTLVNHAVIFAMTDGFDILHFLANSFIALAIGSALAITLAFPAAYAIARMGTGPKWLMPLVVNSAHHTAHHFRHSHLPHAPAGGAARHAFWPRSHVDSRIADLQIEAASAEKAVKSLYSGVMAGNIDPSEPSFKVMIGNAFAKRAMIKSASDRATSSVTDLVDLDAAVVETFVIELREPVQHGDTAARKKWPASIVDRIVAPMTKSVSSAETTISKKP